MSKDEELEQLREENRVLREALRGKDEELHRSQQANQDLREGLRQAIMAIEYLQERVKVLEGQQARRRLHARAGLGRRQAVQGRPRRRHAGTAAGGLAPAPLS